MGHPHEKWWIFPLKKKKGSIKSNAAKTALYAFFEYYFFLLAAHVDKADRQRFGGRFRFCLLVAVHVW